MCFEYKSLKVKMVFIPHFSGLKLYTQVNDKQYGNYRI